MTSFSRTVRWTLAASVILVLVLIPRMDRAWAQDRYSIIRIPAMSLDQIIQIAKLGIALDHVGGRPGRYVETFVSEHEQRILREAEIPFSVLVPDWNVYYRERQASERMSAAQALAGSTVSHFRLGSMGGFLTFAEVSADLDSMQAQYPTLVTRKDSVGQSIEGRPIWAVKISARAGQEEPEPRALYTSLIHAREPAGMMQLIYFMWYLLENYGTNDEVTSLLDHRELYFVPVVNPDGYTYNQFISPGGGGMWRKNRRPNGDGSAGIDLNRNFGFQWGYDDIGSSPEPPSEVYRGTGPFSEPEAQALRELCIAKGFSAALNYHTFGNLLVYPWGFSDGDTPDSLFFRRLGEDMTAFNRYTYGTGGQTVGYVTNGDSDDWMYGDVVSKQRIFSMTPEVGTEVDGFWAATARILPIAQENLSANLYFARAAGAYVGVVSVDVEQQSGSPVLQLRFGNKGAVAPPSHVSVSFSSAEVAFPTAEFPAVAWADTAPLAVPVLVLPSYTDKATIVATITYGGEIVRDTLRVRVDQPTIAFTDDAEGGLGAWDVRTTDPTCSWDTTSYHARSGRRAFAESPQGFYTDNLRTTMQLKNALSLDGRAAELRFWLRWDVETNWDYLTIEVSTNGGINWKPLGGKYTQQGSGVGRQPLYSPGYDGIKHDWVQEIMDIPSGGTTPVTLRFMFQSDDYVTRDGVYLDDIQVLSYGPLQGVVEGQLPSLLVLEQNYPNPFNPSTEIRYRLPARSMVTMRVFDLLGREVRLLVAQEQEAGVHGVTFNAVGCAAGVYVVRLEADGVMRTMKVLLVK